MKEQWRSVLRTIGLQYVMNNGVKKMRRLCADSLDTSKVWSSNVIGMEAFSLLLLCTLLSDRYRQQQDLGDTAVALEVALMARSAQCHVSHAWQDLHSVYGRKEIMAQYT